jgi:hypothetical protein
VSADTDGPTIKSARSQNRAAAWRYDLAQWREYRLAMARTDVEREAIEQEYAQRAAAGPDFCSYHAHSDYREPHVHELDAAGKREILTAFDQVRAWLWRNARKPRGQAVSRAYRQVLSVLLSFAIKYGTVFPSHATIAKLACCSERTVANALQWLRMYGFLTWQRRLKRIPGKLGMIVRQTSSVYRIALQGIGAFLTRAGRNKCTPFSFTHHQPRDLGLKMIGAG